MGDSMLQISKLLLCDTASELGGSLLSGGGADLSRNRARVSIALAILLMVFAFPFAARCQATATAPPVFSESSGGYHAVQTITIADATPGAVIYYTTDGSAPSSHSTQYTGPITVAASASFHAAALAPGDTLSRSVLGWYTIILPAAAPIASLAPGAYSVAQTVTLSDPTPNATIYYSVNGSYPTTSSPIYSGPIAISSNTTLQAFAAATGYEGSPAMSASYTIAAATPAISPASGTYTAAQTVTFSSPTPGAYFRYTTNGSTPTSSSTYYSGPFTASANETIQAIAFASGYSPSGVASAALTLVLPTAAPSFSLAPGTYNSAQTVSVRCSNPSASIYYTTDGSIPTSGSPLYSGSIVVSANETVAAIALAPGGSPSAVSTAAYTIAPPAAKPVFSPAQGVYNTVQTVTISDATSGAVIYYTTDGSTPTSQSSQYSGPVSVGVSENFAAVAEAPGGSLSPVTKTSYTIKLPTAAPVASLAPGAYGTAQSVTLSDATANAVIYYTVTGTYPTMSSPVYSGPIAISSDTTIQALAIAPGYLGSSVLSASYTIAAAAPIISPASGTYTSSQTVTLSSPTPGAYFHYTTDGSVPTSSSAWYGGPITVSKNETIQAVAYAANYDHSGVAASSYTVILPTAVATFSPAAGTYVKTQTVSIGCSNANATIYYTLDGSTPTTGSAVYSGPLTVSANETVSAMALAPASSNSAVSQAAYVITPPALAPVFSLASAVYNTVQTIAIYDATPGAAVYYTTNGTTPTSQSTPYTGPISVSASTNFEAVALAPGGSLSPVTKAWFDIILPTAAPVLSPGGGTYNSIQAVTLTDATPGATIYYTTNGSYPSTSSAIYAGPITAATGTQITAIATAPAYSNGPSASAVYTIIAPAPVISPQSGTLQNTATVTIADAAPGAIIYYTSNGSIPTTASAVYAGPIALSPQQTTTEVYQAIAIAPGYLQSASSMATFTIDLPAGVLAQATVASTPTIAIPPNFLGLSTDFTQPQLMMGQASTGVNQAYRTLLLNLTANGTAPLLFRITGDDSHVSDIQAAAEPLLELAQAVNINYVLGVDLWNNNLALAQAEASAWMTAIPNNVITAFEIGNEPDVYQYNGARPSTYTFAQYLAQFQQWQQGIDSTTGNNFGIMGNSMGGESSWVASAQEALASGALTPTIVSQHSYLGGLTQASGQPWPQDYLLQPFAANEFPTLYASFAASAHKAGDVFRISEMNSFYNGGVGGISNTFSSSLWSIDLMFNYLSNGTDGVNWHSGQGTQYAIFQFHPQTVNGMNTFSVTQVAPLYYGLLIFSEMAGNGAQLLPVKTSTTANVSIWATIDASSAAHMIVINKDEQATGDVQINLPGYTTGTVRYLTAANYSAVNGVTFGGQTFDGTPDGTIQGQFVSTTISANNGVFTLPDMPITSAAVIDFSN